MAHGIEATDLLGTWHLHSWVIEYSDARAPSYPYGKDATGILIYASDGNMSASIAASNRPSLSSERTRKAPADEKIAAFESYFCYSGPYLVKDGQVTHKVTLALNPNFPGSVQVRDIEFAGGHMTLSTRDTIRGAARTTVTRLHKLIWRR